MWRYSLMGPARIYFLVVSSQTIIFRSGVTSRRDTVNLKTNLLFAPTLHTGKNFSKFFHEKSLVSRRMGVRSSIFLKFRKIFSGLLYTNKKLVLRFEKLRLQPSAKSA